MIAVGIVGYIFTVVLILGMFDVSGRKNREMRGRDQ